MLKKRLIPKLFKIRIKTNVPGFQDFEFQGSMIDKNVSSSKKGVLILTKKDRVTPVPNR